MAIKATIHKAQLQLADMDRANMPGYAFGQRGHADPSYTHFTGA